MYVVFKVDRTRLNKFSFSIHICASAAAVLQNDTGGSEVLTRRKAKRSGKDGERQLGRCAISPKQINASLERLTVAASLSGAFTAS